MNPRHTPIRVLAFMEAYVVNGAAKTLLNFCDSLQANGDERVRVAIATFHRGPIIPGESPNEFVAAARGRGIEVFVISERRAFDFGVLSEMRRIAREFAPDVIQTNNVKSHFLVKLSGITKSRHWIAFHHGYTATDVKVKLFNRLDRFSLPAADRVVAVCGAFRNQLTENKVPEKGIRVLHNSAAVVQSLPEVADLRSRLGIALGTKVLLTIGRLSFEKGHADLVRALGKVRQKRPNLNWTLVVVGSGPEQETLASLSKQMGISERLVFAGQQSNVLPYFALSDAMILPSHSEGSPHVVLEAMAAGLPILATRVGGVPEILNPDIAQLVPPRNEAALAEGIIGLLENLSTARARAGKAKQVLEERFSHDAYRENLVRMIEELQGVGV
jgi:glycosyltransferase involved in cell wall biosynthesis